MNAAAAPASVDQTLVSKAMVEAWVKAAAKNDRLVYFVGPTLPAKSKIATFVREVLVRADLVLTAQQRGTDGDFHYMIIRTAKPIPKGAGK